MKTYMIKTSKWQGQARDDGVYDRKPSRLKYGEATFLVPYYSRDMKLKLIIIPCRYVLSFLKYIRNLGWHSTLAHEMQRAGFTTLVHFI